MGYFKGKFDLSLQRNRNFKNYCWLSLRGMLILLPAAIFLAFYGEYFVFKGVTAGLMFVPCYILGSYTKYNTQTGEFLLGCCLTAALL